MNVFRKILSFSQPWTWCRAGRVLDYADYRKGYSKRDTAASWISDKILYRQLERISMNLRKNILLNFYSFSNAVGRGRRIALYL